MHARRASLSAGRRSTGIPTNVAERGRPPTAHQSVLYVRRLAGRGATDVRGGSGTATARAAHGTKSVRVAGREQKGGEASAQAWWRSHFVSSVLQPAWLVGLRRTRTGRSVARASMPSGREGSLDSSDEDEVDGNGRCERGTSAQRRQAQTEAIRCDAARGSERRPNQRRGSSPQTPASRSA